VKEPQISIDIYRLNKDVAIEQLKIHADQRMKLMNFYIIIVGFCIGGYFTNFGKNNYPPQIAISLFLLFMTYCFWKIDDRTRQLVKISEGSLKIVTEYLKKELKEDAVEIVGISDDKKGNWSYTDAIRTIFGGCALLSSIGILIPLCKWILG
jgi:hypothetical protein